MDEKKPQSSPNKSDPWLPRWGVLPSTAAASWTLLTASLPSIWRIKGVIMACLPVRLLLGGRPAGCCLLVPARSVKAAGSCWAQLDPPSFKWKEQTPWQSKNKSWALWAAQSDSRTRRSMERPRDLRFHLLRALKVVLGGHPGVLQGCNSDRRLHNMLTWLEFCWTHPNSGVFDVIKEFWGWCGHPYRWVVNTLEREFRGSWWWLGVLQGYLSEFSAFLGVLCRSYSRELDGIWFLSPIWRSCSWTYLKFKREHPALLLWFHRSKRF